MKLVETVWVKNYFTAWNKYFLNADSTPDESVLEKEIEMASSELRQYIDVDPDNMDDILKYHLLVIIKKRGYDLEHKDEGNEFTPQVVKDYYATLSYLRKMASEPFNTGGESDFTIEVGKPDKPDWFVL